MDDFNQLLSETKLPLSVSPPLPGNIDEPHGRSFDGPLSGEMWRKVKSLNSKMPDTFNWKVYDDLFSKFGEVQPRGGVVFKSSLKLANHHSTCAKCHYAFEIDTYGRGCIHNCSYCYAKAQLTVHGAWNQPHPFPFDLAEIRKIFYTVFETDKKSKWREVLSKRIPLRIGSMSDSFMKMDKKFHVTKELLKILSFYDYPHVIFTRSDLIAEDEYMNLLRKDLCSIQFSISGNNEKLSRLIEPGAPSVDARFRALETLNKSGFWTTVRINPFFPMHPDGYFTNEDLINTKFGSKANAPKLELFDWDMLDRVKEVGTPGLLAGVVRLSGYSVNQMSKVTGINMRDFFDLRTGVQKGDLKYSDAEVSHYYRRFMSESRLRKLRFSTCYIGMGSKDYFQYQNLWSNKTDCCDAKGNVEKIQTTSQSISWDERIKHAPDKDAATRLSLDDMNEPSLRTSTLRIVKERESDAVL